MLALLGRTLQYLADPQLELLEGFYYYTHNRLDELMVGVLIAYFYVRHRERLRTFVERAGGLLGATGVALIALTWVAGGLHIGGAFPVVGQFTAVSVGVGLVVLNGLFLDNALSRFLASPLWYPLARVSYGAYLLHPFVLFGLLSLYATQHPVSEIGAGTVFALSGTVLLVANALAAAMFLLLERPLLDLGGRLSGDPPRG